MNSNQPHPRNIQTGFVRAGDILSAHGAQIEALIRLGIAKRIWTMEEALEMIGSVIDEESHGNGGGLN
jgi:hypothetical protein